MKFDAPAERNIFDAARIVGQPHPRVDGPLKLTGRAPYAHDRHDAAPDQLVGWPIGATIAKGRITAMETAAARVAPGVQAVIATLDMKPLPLGKNNVARLFGGDEVKHYHQAIALVVAETLEQARAAAGLIETAYAPEPVDTDLDAAFARVAGTGRPAAEQGDVEAALAAAPHVVDAVYRTPCQSHAMMEPHASVASWSEDGALTVWTATQMVGPCRQSLARVFGLPPRKVRVDSPFIGGGFGAKLWLRADAVLAALGARATGRPVRVALPRPMVMNNTTHRSATVQRIRLGAGVDGRLTAIDHEAASHRLPGGRGEDATAQTPYFYAAANRRTRHHPVDMHLPESADMRAPGEASGLMALEIAMDEMAEALGMCPVAFRILNDTQVNPMKPGQPFSERRFVDCLTRGAAAFGWESRNRRPGGRRDGRWLVGQGMAGAYRGAPAEESGARLRLAAGQLTVETDMTDIGTGSYTILAQTAAEVMGLPLAAVTVRLGDSDFPASSGSGGQFGAASATAGVYAACLALQGKIARHLRVKEAIFADGMVRAGNTAVGLADLSRDVAFEAEDKMTYGRFRKGLKLATFGAHFVELAVDAATGEVRLRRMLAVCDSGRILNPLTARSQVIGGMVMGLGAALSEELAVDDGRGYFVNHDLAGYEVPVHADIPAQEVIFLDAPDPAATPLKAKGVAELGICGVAAAVANAIHNATGIRLRDYPLTLDKLIDRLPEVGG